MNYDAVASALQCGRHSCPCSNTALKHCPVLSAHRNGDHMPSLSVNVVNGKVLFRCHRGCDQAAVIDALKQRGLWQAQEQRRVPGSAFIPTVNENLRALARINRDVVDILRQTDTQQAMLTQGAEPAPTSPAEFEAFVKRESLKWGRVIREAKIEVQ